ncbi:MAG: hypothetical protein EBR09_05050 [Proteobacteria bacterium]|nr:hypothetical protein [Pseudomonadota bacterium]
MSIDDRSLRIILNLRWIAILGQIAVLFPAFKSGWLTTSSLVPASFLIAFLAAINGSSIFARKKNLVQANQSFLLFQLCMDVFSLTGLLWLSGGAWNPFIILLLFHASLGALFLNGVHLVGYIVLTLWSSTALYSNPVVPIPAQGQSLPPLILYPVHMTALLCHVALIAWVSGRLEAKRNEIETSKEQLRKLDHLRAFGLIAGGFSHEFATPLSTIQIRLKRLQRLVPELSDNTDFQAAVEAGDRCEKSLKLLLARRKNPNACEFRLLNLATELEQWQREWSTGGERISSHISDETLNIRTHEISLKQVIFDLLDNAIKACPHGNVKLSALSGQGGFAEVVIEDNGSGLPMFVREHLGEPFLTTREDGVGLGLYNAVMFSRAMDGRLHIVDRAEGGTKVTLQIPLVETSFA